MAVVLIFASACSVATVAALFLPETAGRPLPETFEVRFGRVLRKNNDMYQLNTLMLVTDFEW